MYTRLTFYLELLQYISNANWFSFIYNISKKGNSAWIVIAVKTAGAFYDQIKQSNGIFGVCGKINFFIEKFKVYRLNFIFVGRNCHLINKMQGFCEDLLQV